MHEMSIAQSLFEIINEEVRRAELERVTVVRLRIGEMSTVVPDALEFCFEVLARDTVVEGASLECTMVPVTGSCLACGESFTIKDMLFKCPRCDSVDVEMTGGDELRIYELEGE
jgi:hydrogenase nickel incorporation protein HypA/HybF